MPTGESNREEIILEVNAPARDFLREGGIANAIAALDVLDARLNKTNALFAQLGGLGGASSPSGLSSQISQTSQLTAEVTRLADAQHKLKVVTSEPVGGGTPYLRATTTGDRFEQTTLFETFDKEGNVKRTDQRRVENFERQRQDAERERLRQQRLREQQEKAEGGAQEARRLAEEKRASDAARGAAARAAEEQAERAREDAGDFDPSGLSLVTRAGRERSAEEKSERNEMAARLRSQRAEAAAAEAARLEAEKREALNIRARAVRAMDDIDPTGLGLLGHAGRERSQEEQRERDEAASRIKAQRAKDATRRAAYGSAYSDYETQQINSRSALRSGITGTPTQRRQREAQIEAEHQWRLGSEATELAGIADRNQDPRQAAQMRKLAADANDAYTTSTLRANAANDQFNQSSRLIGKNMLENIKHVTTWAASVGVLYGTLTVLRRSLEENIAIGREMAILGQIFKGTSTEVSELTTKVMELAAANGQNATEAVEAATEFARIYHTQGEILDATNSALVLANVSGEEAGHTVEFLSAMTMVYKLHASELAGVIGQMAYASQNFNVTNKDLMKGLEATAESAKEAGISFSQLLGFISAGVGATGQSGTAVGNTVKTMIQEMANPEIQGKLRGQSGIEVTEGGVGLKTMPTILREIYEAYERMSQAEKRIMLFNVAGRQNATRMASILDNYVQSQVIAINAQLNLNAAEEENKKIVASLSGQVAGLVSEWDVFVKLQGANGPVQALTEITSALKNLLAVANLPVVSPILTALSGIAIAAGAKTLLRGVAIESELVEGGAKSKSLFANTLGQFGKSSKDIGGWMSDIAGTGGLFGDFKAPPIIKEAEELGNKMRVVNLTSAEGMKHMLGISSALQGAEKGSVGLSKGLTAATVAANSLRTIVGPLAIIMGAIIGFNWMMRKANPMESDMTLPMILGGRSGAAMDSSKLFSAAANVLGSDRTSMEEKLRVGKQIAAVGVDTSTAAGREKLAAIEAQNEALIRQGNILQLINNLNERSGIEARRAKILAQEHADSLGDQVRAISAMQNDLSVRIKNKFDPVGALMGPVPDILGLFKHNAANAPQRGNLFSWLHDKIFSQSLLDDQGKLDLKRMELEQQQREAQAAIEEDRIRHGAGFTEQKILEQSPGARIGALSSGISDIYGTMGTRTALDVHHRDLARLQSDLDMKKAAFDQVDAMRKNAEIQGNIPEILNSTWDAAQGAWQNAGVAFNAQNSPQIEAQRRQQTEMTAQFGWGAARVQSFGVGLTEGEQMAERNRRGYDPNEPDSVQGLMAVNRINEAHAVEMGLLDNKQKALEKIYELEQQRANLAIKVNQEYARSLLTSSPSQLLEKLAVGQLSKNGMSAGSFFAMTTSAREDFMRRPGNTEEERQARRSENSLQQMFPGGHGPDVWANLAVGSSFPKSTYKNMFGNQPAPDLGISAAIQGVISLGGVAAAAAIQITNMKDASVSFIAGLRAAAGAPPTSNSPGFKSPNFLPQPAATIPGWRAYSQP
jgi:TP901 family phage tail tape measure protein